ncbi:DUF2508 family protein [Limnochorda pilosa]|nr:DUF2508 family protein [Limnochorda pilosa]
MAPGKGERGKNELRAAGLVEQLEAARQEWRQARAYFDAVSDPDLVVEAVHRLEASQRKYMYLWKLARAEGVRVDRQRMARFLFGTESGFSS